jgi:hypothetical protein
MNARCFVRNPLNAIHDLAGRRVLPGMFEFNSTYPAYREFCRRELPW